MKRFTQLIGLIGFAVLLVCGPVGCSKTTLSPTGVYQGDKTLYEAEKTIRTVYDQFDTFVTWELQYRAILPVDVSRAADTIRKGSKSWIASAIAARDAYVAVPNAPNKDRLQLTLNLIDTALAEAAKYMIQNQGPAPNRGLAPLPEKK